MQEKEERTTQILSNIVNNTIAMKLEKTIKTEMKHSVLQGMERITAKYFEGLNNQVAQVNKLLLYSTWPYSSRNVLQSDFTP